MMEISVGSCEFCGKTMMIETSGKLGEAEANALATRRCDCEKSQSMRERAAAFQKIEVLFGEGACEPTTTGSAMPGAYAFCRHSKVCCRASTTRCVRSGIC